jgi:hypothetical protein
MATAHVMAMVLLAAVPAGCSGQASAAPAGDRGQLPAGPQLNHAPAPIFAEPLTLRHEFTDDVAVQVRVKPVGRATDVINLSEASNIAVVRFTVQPGVRFPWHSHPGLVMVSVTQGELVFVYADDCIQRPYAAGTAFVDPGFGNIHYAFNPTAGETVVVATFLGVPPTDPLTIPVNAAESTALDAKCGVAASTSHTH